MLSKSTVNYIIKKFKNTKTVVTIHSGGRPKCTSARNDAQIVGEFKNTPYKSPGSVVESLNLAVITRIVQRSVVEAGLKAIERRKNPLSAKMEVLA